VKYCKDKIWLFIIVFLQQPINAMFEKPLEKSLDTFKTIELSIRENNLKEAHMHLKNTFLSEKKCSDLIKIIAVEGDSDDHIEYIKELYKYVGTLFIKKSNKIDTINSSNDAMQLDPYTTGEQIIAQYREKDCNRTDLAYALIHNHPTVFALLMQSNNTEFLKKTGCNLAQSAVILGRIKILQILLEYKTPIDCTIGIHDNSIWHTAAIVKRDNSVEIFELLKKYYEITTKKKLDFSIDNNNKESPLMTTCGLACRYLRPDIVAYLLEQKSDPNTKDMYKDTPLHRAAYFDCPKTVSLLLKSGGNPNAENEKKNTPLHIACSQLNIKSSYKLMKNKNITINAQNKDGDTPLHILLEKTNLDDKEMIKLKNLILFLLSTGAQLDTFNKQGATSLHYSTKTIFLYKKKYLKHIERYHKDLDWSVEQKDTGDTLLHQLIQRKIVSEKDYLETTDYLQFLLAKGVSPIHQNKKKETPLSLITELLKTENLSKKLFEYYTSINLLLTIKQTLETEFKNNLSKKTRNSLRSSLKKNNF